MQRLEIVYLYNLLIGQPPPLRDEAGYWEIEVKRIDGKRFVRAIGFNSDGGSAGEHLAPLSLVRSVSAREIAEPPIGDTPDV